MGLYYDRKGNPMDFEAFVAAFKGNRTVAYTTLPDGARVSTVWLGIDHDFLGKGPPVIFETMVFRNGWDEDFCDRYSTEEDALAGHHAVVMQYLDANLPYVSPNARLP